MNYEEMVKESFEYLFGMDKEAALAILGELGYLD